MDRLIKRDLLNAGLVRLTPHLLARYNECLASMGLPAAEGEHIDIDGVGMSPQTAAKRGNTHYLCNGLANPLALIVCPEQYNKPVYFPLYSWQRPLMRAFFEKYHREIIDITGTHSISVDMENGLSTLESPEDLLLLTEITAVPHMEELTDAAAQQALLISEFYKGQACLDEELADRLVGSRHAHGDLRKRKIAMQPMTFDSFADYYTVAFGGAAVLRHVNGEDLLILENEQEYAKVKGKRKLAGQAYFLFDEEFRLFDTLFKAGWVTIPLDIYRSDTPLLEYKKELLLADALCDCEEGIKWRALTKTARKGLLQRHSDKVPEIYFELERFATSLRNGKTPKISQELGHFLAEPSPHLPPQTQSVVWTLLTKREPRNLLALYTVDKNAFLTRYYQWCEAKQEWAAQYLAERYRHQHRLAHLQQ